MRLSVLVNAGQREPWMNDAPEARPLDVKLVVVGGLMERVIKLLVVVEVGIKFQNGLFKCPGFQNVEGADGCHHNHRNR